MLNRYFSFFRTLFLVFICSSICRLAYAGFGLTTSEQYYTVDTGAGLVFKVQRSSSGSSKHSPGDIESLKIDGVEYQSPSKGSQVNSGFDNIYKGIHSVSVRAKQMNSNVIKITVQAGYLTQYYLARRGERRIYLATYFTKEPTVVPCVRYIFRIQHSKLPNGPEPADLTKVVRRIEAKDIYVLANGQTRSKHYSNHRAIDWHYLGGTGNKIGLWVVRDNYEGSSSGPFYRSLQIKNTKTTNEITYLINYNEAQTDSFRTHVLDHYTFVVTNGSKPSTSIDTSWFKNMGLKGYVPSSSRGVLAGSGLKNMDDSYDYVVALSNSHAQYWGKASKNSGSFKISDILPGSYTMTVFKHELAVYHRKVTIKSGKTTRLPSIAIAADPANTRVIWRIGHWNGSPQEFLNGGKITTMHPSDVRMSSWNTATYTVGSSSSGNFPAYIWKRENNNRKIQFKLTSEQSRLPHVLRIGITVAQSGARPQIKVNNWTSKIPAKSTQPSTRTVTVGTYRGNNTTYKYTIPASAWNTHTDWNTLTISVASGDSSRGYLSPAFSIDCIDLVK